MEGLEGWGASVCPVYFSWASGPDCSGVQRGPAQGSCQDWSAWRMGQVTQDQGLPLR